MTTKLLALDLDGTLLDRQSRLPEATIVQLMAAQAAGIQLLLVTGRSWRGARDYYNALGLQGPAICYLGAMTVADKTGRINHYCPLARQSWDRIRLFALGEQLPITACVGADQAALDGRLSGRNLVAADSAYATCAADDFYDWEGWNTYTTISPDLACMKEPPVMVAVYGDRAVARVLQQFPNGLPRSQFDLTDKIAGETVLHIWHSEVDKGRALSRFCRESGITPEQVIAIGDAPMDISMIRYAGLGVAVPDAPPHVKAAAQMVATPSELIRLILKGDLP